MSEGLRKTKGKKAKEVIRSEKSRDEIAFLEGHADAWYFEKFFILRFCRDICTFIQDWRKDTPEKKKVQRKPITLEGTVDAVRKNQIPIMIVGGILLMITLMLGMEDYNTGASGRTAVETNYYEVLNVPKDSSLMEIKRAYKKLALRYHPDKNPNCTVCTEKFGLIAEANEILTDSEKRAVYDKSGTRASDNTLASSITVTLDEHNFEELVLKSNDVWIIMVYHPDEGASRQFHPFWEASAADEQQYAKFGRINILDGKKVLEHLPMIPRIYPTVMRVGRGLETEIIPIFDSESSSMTKLFLSHYPKMIPTMNIHKNANHVRDWLQMSTARPKVLLVAPTQRSRASLLRRKIAHRWQEFFEFRHISVSDFDSSVKAGELRNAVTHANVVLLPAQASSLEDKPLQVAVAPTNEDEWDRVLHEFVQHLAPMLTVHNYDVLCKSNSVVRTLCLLLIDANEGQGTYQVPKVLQQLGTSHADYQEELKEIRESSDLEDDGELFFIQVARISTRMSWSMLPQATVAYNSKFTNFHEAHGKASAILVDLDTKRSVAITKPSVADLYQSVAYADLKLDEFEDSFVFSKTLPNLKETTKQHARRIWKSLSWLQSIFVLAIVVSWVELFAKACAQGSMRVVGIVLGVTTVVYALLSPPFLVYLISFVF